MTGSDIPIVIIHRGDSEYLPATIFQLRYSNPKCAIHLLGDDGNTRYRQLVSHHKISDYNDSAEKFKTVYKHFSTNGYEFELVCIQRWYILNEFLKKNKIERCLYIDSDVLVYCDVTSAQKGLAKFGMTVSGISAHTNFVNSPALLDEFCNFVTALYTDSKAEQNLQDEFNSFVKVHGGGGISDMTMFTKFREHRPGSIGDISIPQKDNSVFDITLDTLQDYESENGFKKVSWKAGYPVVVSKGLNTSITFNTLHFQGVCKRKIYNYITLDETGKLKAMLWRAGYYRNKILRKIFS
jgi:hypothetical protein